MIFEIVNPSDPYTIEAAEPAVAAAATLVLCDKAGLATEDGSFSMPPMILGGQVEWFRETFGQDLGEFVGSHRAEIATALDSVLIGKATDRRDYYRALELMDDPAKRALYRDEYLDRCRSSMNNFGAYAYKLAARIREAIAAETAREATA